MARVVALNTSAMAPVPLLSDFHLGLLMLVLVVVLWVASSEVTQIIYGQENYAHPFFLTFANAAMFNVLFANCITNPEWSQKWDSLAKDQGILAKIKAIYHAKPSGDGPHHSMAMTAKLALVFVSIWFSANATLSMGLHGTSVRSNTILGSTSGLFTLLLEVGAGTSSFNAIKLVAVCLSIGGVVVVSYCDAHDTTGEDTAWGDVASLLSAFLYGAYLVTLKWKQQDKTFDMPMLLSFMGIYAVLFFWPVFIVLHVTGVELFVLPGMTCFVIIATNAFLGTTICELTWLKAMLMTSPLIATLAMSLAIPLAMLSDWLFKGAQLSLLYILGTTLILISFFVVTYMEEHEPAEPAAKRTQSESQLPVLEDQEKLLP